MTANLLFTGGPIHTMTDLGQVEALQTQGDIITHVGSCPNSLPSGTQTIDLDGRALLPGLCDSHLHLLLAAQQLDSVKCQEARNIRDIQHLVQTHAQDLAPGEWITGHGWEMKHLFGPTPPSIAALDQAAPDNPVFLLSKDVHSAWLNSAAMGQLMARGRLPDGSVLRRDQGIVLEHVMELKQRLVPALTDAQKSHLLIRFVGQLHSHGITSVHTNEAIEDLLSLRQSLFAAVKGKLRILANPIFSSPDELRQRYAELASLAVSNWLGIGGAKLFLDGTLGSLTAAMSRPFLGTADDLGLLTLEPVQLDQWLDAIAESGTYGVFHAIGDRAVALLLNRLQRGPRPPVPHRLEHAQILPQQLPPGPEARALSGLALSCQPSHMAVDRPIAARHLAQALSRRAYAFRTMLKNGALLLFGSDAPVETINPWPGIQAAVTRLQSHGQPAWNNAERIHLAQALAAHTRAPADFQRMFVKTGVLQLGHKADLALLDRDPFAVEPDQLDKIQTSMTFVAGQQLY